MILKVANVRVNAGETLESLQKKVAQLASQSVGLVLFPALTGLIINALKQVKIFTDWREFIENFREELPGANKTFLNHCAALARENKIHLAPGTLLVPQGQGYWHRAYLFTPNGELLGEQCQTHCSKSESALPLKFSNELQVFTSPFGKVGFAIGSDVLFPEVSRILALQGADLVLAPAAFTPPYNPWQQVAAMWQEVQQNQFFCLENWLNTPISGVEFAGRSPILGPCEITPGESGYYTTGEDAEIIVELDFAALQRLRQEYPLHSQLNPGFYSKYFPTVYGP